MKVTKLEGMLEQRTAEREATARREQESADACAEAEARQQLAERRRGEAEVKVGEAGRSLAMASEKEAAVEQQQAALAAQLAAAVEAAESTVSISPRQRTAGGGVRDPVRSFGRALS